MLEELVQSFIAPKILLDEQLRFRIFLPFYQLIDALLVICKYFN